ncbi:proline-rich protein 36-like [Drosophila subpulchrella]|uniref:proline-rich protein 36-like n=1 Tax=Drosophila subpulchrella TaxID=1486046 RepID=UPI0018A1A85C|nr:proline-rich protein 36-like [Drosophila subpulchrella]
MRPQGRKLGLIPEWQQRRPDLGADFNPEWYSGTSVGTPDPRKPHSHVASHEAVKRISRPEQCPQRQQRPVAPTAAPTAPDTWSPATQRASPGARNERPLALSSVQRSSGGVSAPPAAPTHVPTRSTHSAATAPSAASPAPPAALSAAQTQQRPAPCSATHVAIRCPQSGHLALHSGHRASRPTNAYHRPPTAPPAAPYERLPPSAIKQGDSSANRAASAPSAAFSAHRAALVPNRRPQQRQPSANHRAPSGAPISRALSSANRAGYVVTSYERHQERATSGHRALSNVHRAASSAVHGATGAPPATTSVSHCRTLAAPAVRPPHHAPGSAQRPVTPLALTE